MLRVVFLLALRQTEGLIGSGVHLLGLDLPEPDHITPGRGRVNMPIGATIGMRRQCAKIG